MTIRPYISRGKRYWRLDYGKVDGKRMVKQFSTRADAQAALSAARAEREQFGIAAIAALTPAERASFAASRDRLAGVGATIEDAVQHWLSSRPDRSITLGFAVGEFMQSKSGAGLRPKYLSALRCYMRAFVLNRESVLLASLSAQSVNDWFTSRGEALRTVRGNRGRLSSFFSYCVRRGWLQSSPMRQLDRIHCDDKPPKILTPADAERFLRAVQAQRPELVGYVTLGMFCGIRPVELCRLPWSAVDLTRKIVTIDSATSKIRQRRIVDIPPNALAWLGVAERKCETVVCVVERLVNRRLLAIRRTLDPVPPWCSDILRHTAASYMMSRDKDAARVANQLGNSPAILLRHYRELVNAEDSERFWSIQPATAQHLP